MISDTDLSRHRLPLRKVLQFASDKQYLGDEALQVKLSTEQTEEDSLYVETADDLHYIGENEQLIATIHTMDNYRMSVDVYGFILTAYLLLELGTLTYTLCRPHLYKIKGLTST